MLVSHLGADAKPHFYLLEQDKVDIEEEDRCQNWSGRKDPGGSKSYISLSLEEIDLEDRGDWERQHEWLCKKLEIFHKVFSPRVKGLDASNYVPEEEETDRIDEEKQAAIWRYAPYGIVGGNSDSRRLR